MSKTSPSRSSTRMFTALGEGKNKESYFPSISETKLIRVHLRRHVIFRLEATVRTGFVYLFIEGL